MFRDTLYVFGGELSFCNDQETPLWFYHLQVICTVIAIPLITILILILIT